MQMKSFLAAMFVMGMATLALADNGNVIDANGALKVGPAATSTPGSMKADAPNSQDITNQIQSLPPDLQQKILSLPPEQQKAVLKSLNSVKVPGQDQQMQSAMPPPKTYTPPQSGQSPVSNQLPPPSGANELDLPSSPSDANDNSDRNAAPNTALSAPSGTGNEGDMMGQPAP